MNEPLYRHVLFKDLEPYLRRDDYFRSFTDTEKAWIRKSLSLDGSGVSILTVSDLKAKISSKSIEIGRFYKIPYLKYYLLLLGISNTLLAGNVILISDDSNSIYWDIKYDINEEKIIYMRDDLGNEAPYDFKYISQIFDSSLSNNNHIQATNIKLSGECKNNFISGNNIEFTIPVCNLIGELNNIKIDTDEIDWSSNITKYVINIENKYYIDYLDLETLTHLFYALPDNSYITK